MDAGLGAVAAVRDVLEPEATRAQTEARGFRWWPHAFAQHVWSEPARGDGAAMVAAEIVLLAEVRGRGPELARLAHRNAREPGLSALRWDAETGCVSLRAGVIARPGDGGGAARRLSHAALLQLGEALRAADALALELPGARLETPPPPHARALAPVPQVEAARAYASQGAERAETLARVVSRLADATPAPWARVTRAAHGLDAELACGATHTPAAPATGRALLRVSASQPHPQTGPGLVYVLVPPPETEPVAERAAATAALLNEGESREWTGMDQLGGWCVHPSMGLAHVLFVPALAVEDDTALVLAWQTGMRARWATAFLARVSAMRSSEGGSSPER